ncbi:hypothetical protein [Anaerobaca lacustris]|uniref:Uncharacterized protein n=1 Tax=Anaerobaca lacustris TaxID=3044600 RepID=A0AAW6TTG0_9BACT|nr:hypothetical protein [Sedimentisphaerales bacterium M17dextr]
MKEIDFLPEWHKEGRRRRVHMRRQYIVLAAFFFAMVTYNTIAARRIASVNAELNRLDDRRYWAETILREYDAVSKQLGAHQAKVVSIEQVDARIDVAAVLAEISHVIGDLVVLSRVEFLSEPLSAGPRSTDRGGSAVRAAGASRSAAKPVSLGDVRFRVALTGIAASSAEVGALVCRLEDSPYFQQAHPLFRENTIQVTAAAPQTPPAQQTQRKETQSVNVTEFEIVCYLANYEEIDRR